MKTWKNPHETDKIMKAEKELFEVKEIVHQNIYDLLKRGENLETIMAKSKDLGGLFQQTFIKKLKNRIKNAVN